MAPKADDSNGLAVLCAETTGAGVVEETVTPAQEAQVIKRLHQILKNADLEKTTVKNIQKQLEADLGFKLHERKQFIRDEVTRASPPTLSVSLLSPLSSFCLSSRL